MVERLNDPVSRHLESAAEIVPDRDTEFVACLGETQESIAAVAADIAARPGADLAPRDVTTNIVLRTVGMKRDLRSVQHHQQLGFVGMQARQQAIQRDEAGAAEENAVEPGAQRDRSAPAGLEPVCLEAGVEVPDQAAHTLLSGAMLVGKRVELMHQAFRMHPAQRMPANVELPGVIAQHHALREEFVRLNAAPQSAFGGDPHRIGSRSEPMPRKAVSGLGRHVQRGESEPVEMRLPCGPIGEVCLTFGSQAGDQWRGQ